MLRTECGTRRVSVDGKDYLVNEQGKVKTSGTATDADGVKYRVEKKDDGSYSVTIERD